MNVPDVMRVTVASLEKSTEASTELAVPITRKYSRSLVHSVPGSPLSTDPGTELHRTPHTPNTVGSTPAQRVSFGPPSAATVADRLLNAPDAGFADAVVVTVALTSRKGDLAQTQKATRTFADTIAHRWPTIGGVFAADMSDLGRTHMHGLLVVPRMFALGKLIARLKRTWCRLPIWGTKKNRPTLNAAQFGRQVDSTDRDNVRKVLTHHLSGPERAHSLPTGLVVPPMADRIVPLAAWKGLWKRFEPWVRGEAGGPTKLAPTGLHGPAKRQHFPRSCDKRLCLWCGRPLLGMRADAVYHPSCRRSVSRARKRLPVKEQQLVGAIAAQNWDLFVPDIVRIAKAAVARGPTGDAKMMPRALAVALFPLCGCGAPVRLQSRNSTCGAAACQRRRHRHGVLDLREFRISDLMSRWLSRR